ncbi:hypothetical protein [Clostridium felsineum]|uniref:hypothetical protein n=1 Tax=Clostridium felsineum TaxID=36839 RepID=UPI00098C19E9|nr:hypothetical protein [Clostridium felsineum]URZ03978.1 hypothetical protein CLAUR_040440 [Clostridium felsineum]
MIYRAEFTAENLKARLISPVIFGNIAKVYYDILPYAKAKEMVDDLGEALISDMIDKKKLETVITKVKENKKKLYLDELYGKSIDEIKDITVDNRDLKEDLLNAKRKKFREYKFEARNIEIDIGTNLARLRNSINRFNGKVEKGQLFFSKEIKYSKEAVFCIYIKCEDLKTMTYIELAFNVIEKVGIGTDTSIGNGILKFIRKNNKIFTENNELKLCGNGKAINIASTVITSALMKDSYKFIDYIVKRYDSRTPNMVKPFYHYIEAGSTIEGKIESKGNIISDINGIKTYSCVFPIEI